MFSWFTGGDDKPKINELQSPGFHPIVLPPSNAAQTSPYTAPTVTKVNSSPSPPITLAQPSAAAASSVTPISRASEAVNSEDAPADIAPSSFLFSGMEVGKGRRRRPLVPSLSTNSATPHADELIHKSGPSAAAAPAHAATPSEEHHKAAESSSTSPAELRERLDNFYRLYNPAKLAHVEMIMEAYEGREAQLFQELVQRYGPEPVGLSASNVHSLPAVTPPRTASESAASAFRFISATAEAEVAAWAAAPLTNEEREKPNGRAATPPVCAALRLSSSSTGQEDAAEVAQESQRTTTVSSSPSPAAVEPADPQQQQGERTSVAQRPAPPSPTSSSAATTTAGEEAEEKETPSDRHRRELRVSQGVLLEARAALATLLLEAQHALQQRQEKVAHIHGVESQIQECVRAERYREADVLSGDVKTTAHEVQRCDEVWVGLGRRVTGAQRQLEEAVRGVASLLRAQEAELQSDEERERARVQAQQHRDDSDLRLREETVEVRKENLTLKKSAAEARLRAARAGEADLQKRVDATLSATRAQQESLTKEVGELDSQIEDLKAQLRQLEARRAAARAQLSAVDEKLQTAKAAHTGELDAAAAAVESGEREVQRVRQQWSDVEAEAARIAAERAGREAATAELQRELTKRREEREAVHQRTRALEQDTIPASDRYWKSWQDLLAMRLRGADVLFEIPAASYPDERLKDTPSALAKRMNLLTQLDALTSELDAEEELRRDAQRRLEVCEARVAPLCAAKSAAVASKNFKEAQHCADELRVVQQSIEGCRDDVELYGGQVRALERTMRRLRSDLATVEAETRRYASDFRRDYGAAVEDFAATAANTPDYVQLPKESQGADELAEAVHGLWGALRQEWLHVRESSTAAAAPDGAVGEAAAAQTSSPPVPSPASSTTEAAAATSTTDDVPNDSLPSAEEEELRRRLEELQRQLEAAIAREAFDECDVIQRGIDQLEANLAPAAPSS
ncbi:hypothetical protein ABB37_08024 [Leptomonas pyrrhocoris]|uniref:Uncharacterized protein n=1 Tax=Leptomonas pyrrhocoris TaxID=157538 RepID=A0A0N0DSR1_LEPPY|nr:hypothetical protein ABB37_08024 [Leptomonas pyrrhocoris]XP_015654738.1 hypothetical protein ABB37_08024 [Leptomonas pyrrhocoris]KPA76298.1 hypothetical protein ABB37_08024 [Leptomonas pyrrhocoris]KPA76299.1 hypothetical protein ABB37_08024 [Leptomonas pyrrhocoris]|eukprot:XP_015654737.1 hypothetical protein ABB37_08024 [Leptomonas pyrrhocoris]